MFSIYQDNIDIQHLKYKSDLHLYVLLNETNEDEQCAHTHTHTHDDFKVV